MVRAAAQPPIHSTGRRQRNPTYRSDVAVGYSEGGRRQRVRVVDPPVVIADLRKDDATHSCGIRETPSTQGHTVAITLIPRAGMSRSLRSFGSRRTHVYLHHCTGIGHVHVGLRFLPEPPQSPSHAPAY